MRSASAVAYVIVLTAALLAALATGRAAAAPLPSFEAVRAAHRPSDVPLLDRHGVPLHWLRIDASVRRGPWIALEDIAPSLSDALVLGEDRRFWAHAGVDWRALAAGAWASAANGLNARTTASVQNVRFM